MSFPLRVLIIEDRADRADTLAVHLEMSGMKPLVALGATDGIRRAFASHPDVIICDMELPDGDGADVCLTVRSARALDETVILAFSGYTDEDAKGRAMAVGFDGYLVKPCDPILVASTLKEILTRRRP